MPTMSVSTASFPRGFVGLSEPDDLGVWRATWNRIGEPYVTRYHEHFPASPPEEDRDDRNALYAT